MNDLKINTLNKSLTNPIKQPALSYRGTNISVQQPDTTTINNKKKCEGKPLGLKLLLAGLGIGAAILAFVKLHKTSSVKQKEELSVELKEIKKIYKEIFKREINEEEVRDFAKRYKEIIDFKTDNNDREYCDKLLAEICKDRRIPKPEILRWIEAPSDASPATLKGMMSTSPDGRYIDIYSFNYKNKKNSARNYFESLFHETHHVKQDEIIFRTDKEFFITNLFKKFILNGEGKMYKEMLQANNGDIEKTKQEVKERILEIVNNYWGQFTPYKKDSAEYKEGLRLIEGKKNYKFFGNCSTQEEYENQVIEKGAYSDGREAERLFDILKKISL